MSLKILDSLTYKLGTDWRIAYTENDKLVSVPPFDTSEIPFKSGKGEHAVFIQYREKTTNIIRATGLGAQEMVLSEILFAGILKLKEINDTLPFTKPS